ncbi:Zinc finger, RING/FYVE/PHD-type [Cynara cardunculus var. scolymus]|uniref:Zinc finger, RING/FYVE/PHD-type n=1 Tax=Cynara cardunculus var. scolymus TaxID=59895 RepID=A0A118K468_CYNCS|nr:Zinc finger, RING/FYVE/PHD-type [Cynara cardunculus var. scolymus]
MASSTQPFHWQYDEFDDANFQIRGHTLLYVLVLFSIILTITFFFYLCTRSRRILAARSSSGNSLPVSQPQGLDAATINSLPITIHHVAPSTELSECSICLGVFEEGEKVKVLPSCCHCYHCECVDKWLITRSSCPICRTSARIDSPLIVTAFNYHRRSSFQLSVYRDSFQLSLVDVVKEFCKTSFVG